jgi:hypothetical protein
VYDKLYKLGKEKEKKLKNQKDESTIVQASKELAGCTFKPNLVSQQSFEKSISSTEKPKGYLQSVERMRRGILENLHKKFLVQK